MFETTLDIPVHARADFVAGHCAENRSGAMAGVMKKAAAPGTLPPGSQNRHAEAARAAPDALELPNKPMSPEPGSIEEFKRLAALPKAD